MAWWLIPLPYIFLKTAEAVQLQRVYRQVPCRIHVNGTRGKSSVVRLITAGLIKKGFTVLGKVTGERPALLGSGGEREIRRFGPANIKEQIWTLKEAARIGAEVAVLECMALAPSLQAASERIIRSQIGVITSAVPDHLDVMGSSQEEVARALSAMIPAQGHLFVPASLAPLFQEEAWRKGTTLKRVDFQEEVLRKGKIWEGNLALAKAVCRHLGAVGPDVEKAMEETPLRFSSFRCYKMLQDRWFVSAWSANDPISSYRLLQAAQGQLGGNVWLGVFNHRRDRNFRIHSFQSFIQSASFSRLYHVGDWHYGFRRWPGARYYSLTTSSVQDLFSSFPPGSCIFGFGNYRGAGEEILKYLERTGQQWTP